MSLQVNVQGKENEFSLDDDKDAYIVYIDVFQDKFMEIYEKHGKYQAVTNNKGENQTTFQATSYVEPMKEILGYSVQELVNVEDSRGNSIEPTGENVYRTLAQVGSLQEFMDEITPEELGGEVKNS